MHRLFRGQVQPVSRLQGLLQHVGCGLRALRARDRLDEPGPEYDVRCLWGRYVLVSSEYEGCPDVRALRDRVCSTGGVEQLHGLSQRAVRGGWLQRVCGLPCWDVLATQGLQLHSLSDQHVVFLTAVKMHGQHWLLRRGYQPSRLLPVQSRGFPDGCDWHDGQSGGILVAAHPAGIRPVWGGVLQRVSGCQWEHWCLQHQPVLQPTVPAAPERHVHMHVVLDVPVHHDR